MSKKNEIQPIDTNEENIAFQQVCDIIEFHRTRALMAVNQEHLQMCCDDNPWHNTTTHNF